MYENREAAVYSHRLQEMSAIVRQAGKRVTAADLSQATITEKSAVSDLVTDYDVAVQNFLREKLTALLPDSLFLGEEDGLHTVDWNRPVWIVDPIDGTTNFVKGFRHSAISVGLAEKGRITAGVVLNPFADELFAAERGKGAWLNGAPIQVSSSSLTHGIAILGSAPFYKEELADITFRMLRRMFDTCMDIRRTASAALDLCYIAAGRGEAYFEYRVCPWDCAAGSLIAEEAGALVTTLQGTLLPFDKPTTICAASPENHRQVLQLAEQAEGDGLR